MSRLSSLALAALFISPVISAETRLIHAGSALLIPGEDPQSEISIVITDGEITRVEEGYLRASSIEGVSEVIDLKDAFVMPGLMDMHVHLQGELGPRNDSEALRMSAPLVGMRTVHFGRVTLEAGFTTVRDVGSNPQYMYAYRDAVNNGWVQGPRVIAAGSVGITGGHSDVSGVSPELMEFHSEHNRSLCDGPYDCRRATRDVIKYGADLIKITSTGGVLTDRATGTGQQMEMDELEEVVGAARRMGRKVASHAHQEEGIIAALRAGVDSIEHGSYAGPESYELFKTTGAYLVPTLLAGDTVVDMANNSNVLSPSQAEKAIRVGADMIDNFGNAYRAGVRIAFGTDSGVSRHGTNAREAVLMHEAGMSEMDVLVSATVNAADLIDMTDHLGTLEVGKRADIIALSDSPLSDIEALLNVGFVMKDGAVVKNELD